MSEAKHTKGPWNLTEKEKLKIERESIHQRIGLIENKTGKMFHEIQAETDTEIHELAWNDRKRLRSIRWALETAYDL